MAGNASKEMMHSYADRGEDFYATPPEAVEALMRVEDRWMPRTILEPACGDGAIVTPLRKAGYWVQASDLVERGCPHSESGVDFLTAPMPFNPPVGGIVTNPPFKHAQAFVDRAVTLAPYVAMLLRVSFLEGTKRKPWFESGTLARVHISSRRLPMMHRGGWEGNKAGSSIAFAWFVWDDRHLGPPVIRWFDWKDIQ